MTIYFARPRLDTGKVKIGFTTDVRKRIKGLSTAVPGGLELLATIDGGLKEEKYLHDKFAELCIGGEWFHYAEPIRKFVRDILDGKDGLIPFRTNEEPWVRKTAEFADEAVAASCEMVKLILDAECKGAGDNLHQVMRRVQKKYGLSMHLMRRLRYRDMKDIRAGEFLHIKSVYELVCIRQLMTVREGQAQ